MGSASGCAARIVLAGTISRKNRWTPGIYDSVSELSDDPVITTVQVEPEAGVSSIVHKTIAQLCGAAHLHAQPQDPCLGIRLVPLPRSCLCNRRRSTILRPSHSYAKLWWPEDPTIRLERHGRDSRATVRHARASFDTPTKRRTERPGVLMRGSKHHAAPFFEDPKSGALPPWRAVGGKLLVEIPKEMHLIVSVSAWSGTRQVAGQSRRGGPSFKTKLRWTDKLARPGNQVRFDAVK